MGDTHPELRRNDIQPFTDVFTNDMALAAIVTDRSLWRDHLLYARQVFRQRSPVDLAGLRGLCRRDQRIGFAVGLDLHNPSLDIFQRQLELILSAFSDLRPKKACMSAATSVSKRAFCSLWVAIMALSASMSSGRSAVAIMTPIYQNQHPDARANALKPDFSATLG